MTTMPIPPTLSRTDPRFLRALFDRAADLSREHRVKSVFVGIAGREGDLLARDFIDFLEAELRVEDGIFRLLRERALLLLTDVGVEQAAAVLERLQGDFAARFASAHGLRIDLGFHAVSPGQVPTAKDVLPLVFAPGLSRGNGGARES
jgi:hypothetical protein